MKKKTLFENLQYSLEETLENINGTNKISLRSTTLIFEEPPVMTADKILKIRKKLSFSQAVLSKIIGVSPKTIEAWESGKNTPNGPSRLVLSLLDKDPKLPEKYQLVHS